MGGEDAVRSVEPGELGEEGEEGEEIGEAGEAGQEPEAEGVIQAGLILTIL